MDGPCEYPVPPPACTVPLRNAIIPDWCCSPTALCICSPSTIRSLLLTGSSGARIGLSTGAVSVPVGRHLSITVPPGWNTLTKRFPAVPAARA